MTGFSYVKVARPVRTGTGPTGGMVNAPNASPPTNRRSDRPAQVSDRVERSHATPTPAGINRNGWPSSPECTLGSKGHVKRPG
jgi:hypothetical protein